MNFGRYELCEKMGAGGMGEVFRARLCGIEGFEKQFALKRIFHHLSQDETYRRLFIREAKITARLEHPNIVQVHDLGEIDGQLYLAMAFVNGPNFAEIIRGFAVESQLMPPEVAAVVAFDVLEALDFAHHYVEEGDTLVQIVHRDVSPENILIERRSGLAKLCDFGVVQATGLTMDHLRHRVVGKVRYMAPEQARTELIDARVDLYSLGAVLYHALSGRVLLAGVESMEALARVQKGPVPSLAEVTSGVPAELLRIVDRAMAFDARDRYQTAAQFREDIEAYLVTRDPRGARAELRRIIDQVSETVQHDISTDSVEQDTLEATRLRDDSVRSLRGTQRWDNLVAATQVRGLQDVSGETATVSLKSPSHPRVVEPRHVAVVDADVLATTARVPVATPRPPARHWHASTVAAAAALLITVFFFALLVWVLVGRTRSAPVTELPVVVTSSEPAPHAVNEPVGKGVETDGVEPVAVPAAAVPPVAAPPATDARATSRPRVGYLNLSARPWAYVSIDGSNISKPTPLRRHPLSSGPHRVVLTGPDGSSMSFVVHIRAGQTTTKRVGFR